MVAYHGTGSDSPWTYGIFKVFQLGKAPPKMTGACVSCPAASNPQPDFADALAASMVREDGYQVRGLNIQGARSFDSSSQQWTTPDAYKGEVHDPMSQRSYMWNNNNPVAFSDPSGYCVDACVIEVAGGLTLADGALIVAGVAAGAVGAKGLQSNINTMQTAVDKALTAAGEAAKKSVESLVNYAHRNNARPSTGQQHQEGEARLDRDQGGEKGDNNRRPNRKKPDKWKGPWPPKPKEK